MAMKQLTKPSLLEEFMGTAMAFLMTMRINKLNGSMHPTMVDNMVIIGFRASFSNRALQTCWVVLSKGKNVNKIFIKHFVGKVVLWARAFPDNPQSA